MKYDYYPYVHVFFTACGFFFRFIDQLNTLDRTTVLPITLSGIRNSDLNSIDLVWFKY